MRHIRIDNQPLNSERKFACGIGPELPPGDTYVFIGGLEHTVDCPGCNGGQQQKLGIPLGKVTGEQLDAIARRWRGEE